MNESSTTLKERLVSKLPFLPKQLQVEWPWNKTTKKDHAFYDVEQKKVLYHSDCNVPSAWHLHANYYVVRKPEGSLWQAHAYISRLRLRRFEGLLAPLGYLFPYIEQPTLTVTLTPLHEESEAEKAFTGYNRQVVQVSKKVTVDQAFIEHCEIRGLSIVESLGVYYVPGLSSLYKAG